MKSRSTVTGERARLGPISEMHIFKFLLPLAGITLAAPAPESPKGLEARGDLNQGQLETIRRAAHYLPQMFEEIKNSNARDPLFSRYFGGYLHKPATTRSKRVKEVVQDILDQRFGGDSGRTSSVETGFTLAYGGSGPGDCARSGV